MGLKKFLGSSMWLMVATAVANVLNCFYHLYMVRWLPPSEYAMLTALLAGMTLIAVPAATVQTTTAHRMANLSAQQAWLPIKREFLKRLARVLLAGVACFLLLVFLREHVRSFLKFQGSVSIIVYWAGVVGISLMLPVVWGTLQGLQAFPSLGANLVTNGVLKVGPGIAFVTIGWGVLGATKGLLIGIVVTMGVAVFQIRQVLRSRLQTPSEPQPWWDKVVSLANDGWHDTWVSFKKPWNVSQYAVIVALSVLAYSSLTNTDVVLVKHYFESSMAGRYAVGATMARMVLFLPMALSMVLFPNVTHTAAIGQDPRPLLQKVMLATGALSGTAALVCYLFPETIMQFLTGRVFPETIPVIRVLAGAMACMSVANLFLVYLLAVQRYRHTIVFWASALLQIGAIMVWHNQITDLAWITLCLSLLLATYALLMTFVRPLAHHLLPVSTTPQ